MPSICTTPPRIPGATLRTAYENQYHHRILRSEAVDSLSERRFMLMMTLTYKPGKLLSKAIPADFDELAKRANKKLFGKRSSATVSLLPFIEHRPRPHLHVLVESIPAHGKYSEADQLARFAKIAEKEWCDNMALSWRCGFDISPVFHREGALFYVSKESREFDLDVVLTYEYLHCPTVH